MITPQEAYDICLNKIPNLIDDGLFGEAPEFYIVSNAKKRRFRR